jgi:HTH-type transcriptional regulator/antitoxin HipB
MRNVDSQIVFPTQTSLQLQIAVRELRKQRGMTQTEVGACIGVSQMRVAQIERDPFKTSFEQVARMVAALGGSISIRVPGNGVVEEDVSSGFVLSEPEAKDSDANDRIAAAANW